MMRLLTQVLSFLTFAGLFANQAIGGPKTEHVFIFSIDGGKPEVITNSAMPNLQRLVQTGAHTWTAQSITPSITLPSHTSMLTGVGPERHKINWNSWKPEKGQVTVPTVFSMAASNHLSTAMFVGKEKFRHLVLPTAPLIFAFRPTSASAVIKSEGKSKAVAEKTVRARFVAETVAECLATNQPSLCFIHFTDADDAGHKYGWGSAEQTKAFASVDQALGVVLKAIQDSGIAEKSIVIVTADHGGSGKTHGKNVPENMNIPWIAWGAGVKKGFEIKVPIITYDTTVTALWLLGVTPPSNLEGKAATSAFE